MGRGFDLEVTGALVRACKQALQLADLKIGFSSKHGGKAGEL